MLSPASDTKAYGVLYDFLTEISPDGQVTEDGLLTGWERVDLTTWLFDVRPDVSFTNGEPFDADAVAFALEQSTVSPSRSGVVSSIETVTPEGDQVRIVTSQPFPALPTMLSQIPALPPAYYAEVGDEGFAQAPIGTGAWTLGSYSPGQSIVYNRNDDYWGTKAAAATLEFSFSPETSSRAALVQSGQADLATDLLPSAAQEFAGNASVAVYSEPAGAQMNVFITDNAPFDNPDVRKAAQMAIDREGLAGALFGEGAAVDHYLFSDIGSDIPMFDDTVTYDPEAARALLASTGADTNIEFTFPVGRTPNDDQVGEAISGMFEEVGFTVKRNPLPFTEVLDLITDDATAIFLIGSNQQTPTPYSMVNARVLSFGGWPVCPSPELDASYETVLESTDPEDTALAYQALEQMYVQDDACALPLYEYNTTWLASPSLTGVTVTTAGWPVYDTLAMS
ncbi:hypothetical protein GIS00_00210 [Nakamurella sp. YIM 132087]|uniref:Solute-binding protein family 5 domain-containing protein n=1 Tax=Nakamurella alba TaxID=2665158 RepID=A0A7K1FHL8_9ACTN|nr:ABC transporter substrate-binding protein [Nakamurella alba]MTD12364.1 hypothetical protein [Nakamurella alba]